jgi:two-component system LytT family response regulator
MKKEMKAIIVDDEFSNRDVLRSLLTLVCPDVIIAGEAASAKAAYDLICLEGPDLVFLDIQMPHENGFDLLRKFERIPFDVVFVTSYNEYAIDAIRFSALDYLLKPVEIPLLQSAVEKAKNRIASGNLRMPQIVNLLHNTDKMQQEKKIALHTSENVVFVSVNEIICIVGDGNYSYIHTTDLNRYVSSKTIKDYEGFLAESGFFIRISKGCLINAHHIKEYSKGDPCIVTMKNGMSFEMSRRKKQEALEALKLHNMKKTMPKL